MRETAYSSAPSRPAILKYSFSPEDSIALHGMLRRDDSASYVTGCNWLLEQFEAKERVSTARDAKIALQGLFHSLLSENRRIEAALLCWGPTMFDPRARSATMIREASSESNKVLVIGGAGTGKTWPGASDIVLDVAEDPDNIEIKVISSTAGHAKNNLMAKIFRFHAASVIPLPGYAKTTSLVYKNKEVVSQVAIPEGDTGKGRLTGFHPMPRTEPHPKFGNKTRVKAYVDEADTVPFGLWEGLDNLLSTEDEIGSVQVVAYTNPRDKSNPFAARAEPQGGFSSVDPDKDDTWISRDGWRVVRLDPAKSENVVQRKEVYPGMMTYQGYQNYVRKGKGNPEYWIMGRGWYPEQAAEFIVVSSQFFDKARGTYLWSGETIPIGSLDPAFAEGGDDPTFTAGVTGTAIGFKPVATDENPEPQTIMFPRALENAIQLEQQFSIQKSDDHQKMGLEVIEKCNHLGIRPEWFVMDRTGNALGLYSFLLVRFGSIMGIEWGGGATEFKILQEDAKTAEERFDGISTEMYFAFGLWLQYGHIKFAPIFANFQAVSHEISSRKYYFHRGLQKLEDKASFKASNKGKSPDPGDSAVMASHLVRIRKQQNPAMLPGEMAKKKALMISRFPASPVNKMESYDIS